MWVKKILSFTLAYFLFVLMSNASAERLLETEEGYEIHYNALITGALQPEIAQSYGITRSKTRGMLTISIRKKEKKDRKKEKKEDIKQSQPAKGKVTAHVVNLNQQLRTLNIREITETGAVYYISDFKITNEETLKFTVTVDPEFQGKEYTLEFSQQFFVD